MIAEAPPAAPIEAPPAIPPSSAQPPPTSGISEPWAKSWIKPDFSLDHAALERLPDHLKGMKDTLSNYGKFEDALTGWQNQQVMAGKKALAPLPADAKPEVFADRKALMDTINGVPANPKDYGITKPADLPDGHWNQVMADKYAAWGHKYSVPPVAMKELMGEQLGTVKGQLAEQAKGEAQFWSEQDRGFQAIIQRDNIAADRASALVEKGAVALGLDITNEQTKTFLKGTDARLMAMRHAIAIGEDKAVTATGGQNNNAGDPAELANSVVRDASNPLNGPYWNKDGKYSRADHEAAVEKVNGWRRMAAEKNPPRGKR
jgi:hypothetical protein